MDADEIHFKKNEYRLEQWKVLVSILTPLMLLVLTFVINNAVEERSSVLRIKEQTLGEKQRIYGELGKKLNIIFVYIDDVGDYRAYTPPQIIEIKRQADRLFFTYKPYWKKETVTKYDIFMKAAFQTYTGSGKPAKIKTSKREKVAAYDFDNLSWNSSWDSYYLEPKDSQISFKYYDLLSSILMDTVSSEINTIN